MRTLNANFTGETMKKKILFSTLALFLTFALSFAEPEAQTQTRQVKIRITNITTTSGTIVVSVHDSDESFKKRTPIQTLQVPANDSSVEIVLNLLSGEYAFSVFHDTNDDGDLNAGFMGIPKEPFGFSNYAGKTPPGNFKKHKVLIQDGAEIFSLEIPLCKF